MGCNGMLLMLTVEIVKSESPMASLLWPGFMPVCSMGVNQIGRLHLGQQEEALRYFGVCGLQEGYQPFARNMSPDVPLWMSWRQPHFTPVPPDCHIQVEEGRGGRYIFIV